MEIKVQQGLLTAPEAAALFDCNVTGTLIQRMHDVFLDNIDDQETAAFLRNNSDGIASRRAIIAEMLGNGAAVPIGFGSEEVQLGKPRLFTDDFYLYYGKNMARSSSGKFMMYYTEASRPDVRQLFAGLNRHMIDVDENFTQLLKKKGIYNQPPFIQLPEKREYVADKSMLESLMSKPPLYAHSIATLFFAAFANAVGKALLLGFSQVSSDNEVIEYLTKGKEMAGDFYQSCSNLLNEEDVSAPQSLESEVVGGSSGVFSDRLMVGHVVLLSMIGLGTYVAGMSATMRPDVSALFGRMVAQTVKYTDDGIDLMKARGWLEKPATSERKKAFAMA